MPWPLPWIYYYVKAVMFLLSVACVESWFSKIKLIKTRLRNQLAQTNLNNLLGILTEAPINFQDDEYEYWETSYLTIIWRTIEIDL